MTGACGLAAGVDQQPRVRNPVRLGRRRQKQQMDRLGDDGRSGIRTKAPSCEERRVERGRWRGTRDRRGASGVFRAAAGSLAASAARLRRPGLRAANRGRRDRRGNGRRQRRRARAARGQLLRRSRPEPRRRSTRPPESPRRDRREAGVLVLLVLRASGNRACEKRSKAKLRRSAQPRRLDAEALFQAGELVQVRADVLFGCNYHAAFALSQEATNWPFGRLIFEPAVALLLELERQALVAGFDDAAVRRARGHSPARCS